MRRTLNGLEVTLVIACLILGIVGIWSGIYNFFAQTTNLKDVIFRLVLGDILAVFAGVRIFLWARREIRTRRQIRRIVSY